MSRMLICLVSAADSGGKDREGGLEGGDEFGKLGVGDFINGVRIWGGVERMGKIVAGRDDGL